MLVTRDSFHCYNYSVSVLSFLSHPSGVGCIPAIAWDTLGLLLAHSIMQKILFLILDFYVYELLNKICAST